MFPGLRALNTSQNRFSGSVPSQWQQSGIFQLPALKLTTTTIQHQSLIMFMFMCSGSLPAGASMFPGLRALNISQNRFSGSIPTQWQQSGIFQLPALKLNTGNLMVQVFDLTFNQFKCAPPCFCRCP